MWSFTAITRLIINELIFRVCQTWLRWLVCKTLWNSIRVWIEKYFPWIGKEKRNFVLLSSLRTLMISQDYSTAPVLLSPNTCRDVFDERVFAHQRRNLWTPHRDSCVTVCVFNVAVSRRSFDNKKLCWGMTRHLPEQTRISHTLVCVRLTTVFSFCRAPQKVAWKICPSQRREIPTLSANSWSGVLQAVP